MGAIDLSGNGSTCALISGGNIECWGSAFNYEYLVGYNHPYTISGRNAVAIARSGGDLCWLDAAGSVSCMRTNNGQVIATAPTASADVTPPVVTYSGNAGTYTVDQTVAITCAAADPTPGSGLASTTCANASGPAYGFNIGANTLSATATDVAGNVGSGTTTFYVQVTSATRSTR